MTYKEACELLARYDKTCTLIVSSFGNVAIQVDDSDYQGDTRVFYDEGTSYGYLQFGWGSCSGCDALQSCNTIDGIQNLMDSFKGSNKVVFFKKRGT